MKRLLIYFLSCFMLISCLGVNVSAQENQAQVTLTDVQEVLQAEDPAQVPEDYANKVANIVINFAWAFSGGGNFLYGACLGGGIAGIVDVATDLLSEVIYFGPSKEELDRQELMDTLSAIDASIGDVSSKVDSLADQISRSIKQIDEKLDNISIQLHQNNITDVARIVTNIRTEMNTFNTELNGQIQTWYFNQNINSFLTNDNFILRVPNGKKKQVSITDDKGVIHTDDKYYVDEMDTITIPRTVMSDAISAYLEAHKSESLSGWDPSKKDDIAKAIFASIIDNVDKSSSGIDAWVNKRFFKTNGWTDLGDKTEATNLLVDSGYASLLEVATRNIARGINGRPNYLNNLINNFTTYCNYLSAANMEYTSPLESYAKIYSSIYAFQGDLKTSLQVDEYDSDGKKTGEKITLETNLLQLAMQKYIKELNELGSFVGIMAKASGNYGEETDMRSLVYIPWAAAEKKLEDDYKKFYHTKKVNFGGGEVETEVDNYCYLTNSVIGFYEGTINCDLVMKFYAWENGFGTDIKSYRDTYMAEDWSFNMDNNRMLDSTNLSLIFAHYINTNGNTPFKDYLIKNRISNEDDYDGLPSEIVTRFIGGRDFTSDDKVTMFVKNCHNNPDKWEGKDYLKGDTTTVTSTSKYFKVRRKATADVFDLNTGISTLGKRIGAVASFYEKYTFKDDLVVFWDAEYNNPANKDELIALANKDKDNVFYWRDRYDTESDDEERYRSHVEYARNYGVLLSFDLNDPSAPVPDVERLSSESFKQIPCFASNVSNIMSEENNALVKALEKAGICKQEYEDFVYDDTYRVYFDETKYDGLIDEELYTRIINYCQNQHNINKMVYDYYHYNGIINDMIDGISDQLVVSDNTNRLTRTLIENDLDCIIVNNVPKTNLGKNVFNFNNGKLYIWKDNKYVEYENSFKKNEFVSDVENKFTEGKDNDSEYFTSKFNSSVLNIGDYPTIMSKDINLAYTINTVLAFELYFDEFDRIAYRVHPIYDVNPVLCWYDGSTYKEKVLSDKVLELSNIDSMNILLPIIELDSENDNNALVKHFFDLDQLESPIEVLDAKIVSISNNKYSKLIATTFSPYVVSSTYFVEGQRYRLPKTGIN